MIIRPESHAVDEDWSHELNEEWRAEAACQEYPAETWFPRPNQITVYRHAKTICAGCPVKSECLEYALTWPTQLDGVWGGLTARERQKLRRAA